MSREVETLQKIFIKKAKSFLQKMPINRSKGEPKTMDTAISNMNAAGLVVPAIILPGSAAGSNSSSRDPTASASQEPRPVSSEAVNQLLDQVQSQLESMNISLSFSTYGNKGEDIAVIVTDKNTGKVIREIPSTEIQNLQMKLGELIGLIFNHSV